MSEQEKDLIELETEDGDTVELEVERYFFYNGDEYVLLCGTDEGKSRYIMKVVPVEGEEDMEEFEPISDELTEQLIHVIETNFSENDAADQ